MASVELRFPPNAGHVRIARLVAVAVARRARLDDVRVDELRLAVGEACARAVRRCELTQLDEPIVMRIDDGGPGVFVEVLDRSILDELEDPVVFALLQGLADTLEVTSRQGGVANLVRLGWLATHHPAARE
jgi:anti-sigma regulatory factor (Ser/Thr protein kinase)